MVNLSKSITQKLRDKGNDISNDEVNHGLFRIIHSLLISFFPFQTVLFKSHLLSLGINEDSDDPVLRSQFSSDNKYYLELGKQITKTLKPIVERSGGQMSLTDAFCTINRARGLDVSSHGFLVWR